jgi:hypothetical protein
VDERWVQTALEVMVEHTGQSTPSRKMVIERAHARLVARFGVGVVTLPSRATAYRLLEELERRHPTFRLSSKRNQDIAGRPGGVYGKLRPRRAAANWRPPSRRAGYAVHLHRSRPGGHSERELAAGAAALGTTAAW